MREALDRRRFIAVSAAAAGLGLIPFGAPKTSAAAHVVEWRGVSLGSVATIRIHHPDPVAAQRLIEQAVGEAHRLETVFSLYRQDSSLAELNRRGVLVAPPAELSDLLTLCDRFWRMTNGAFDPSVQPLWQCYADHFATSGSASTGPSMAKIKDALKLVGWEKVHFDRDKVVFARPGMGLTLNGIAQGYITDRVVESLRSGGIASCLADMGEIRGLGAQPDGRPWPVVLEAPSGKVEGAPPIPIVNKAVATSGAAGFRFDEQGRCNHLFDPSTGACADPARNLTVVTDAAVTADALSTAFALMDEVRIKSVLSQSGTVQVYVTTEDGTRAIPNARA
jgi:thiamine biosynthesis lipoprotein